MKKTDNTSRRAGADPPSENHSFNANVAKCLDVVKAIILFHIEYQVRHHTYNKRNLHAGLYWYFDSAEALSNRYKYLKRRTISRHIKELENAGIIATSSKFNKQGYDRTKWYTLNYEAYTSLTQGKNLELENWRKWRDRVYHAIKAGTSINTPIGQNGQCIGQNGQPIGQNGQPIPNTYPNTNSNTLSLDAEREKENFDLKSENTKTELTTTSSKQPEKKKKEKDSAQKERKGDVPARLRWLSKHFPQLLSKNEEIDRTAIVPISVGIYVELINQHLEVSDNVRREYGAFPRQKEGIAELLNTHFNYRLERYGLDDVVPPLPDDSNAMEEYFTRHWRGLQMFLPSFMRRRPHLSPRRLIGTTRRSR